jgi:ankyrin repeat protein
MGCCESSEERKPSLLKNKDFCVKTQAKMHAAIMRQDVKEVETYLKSGFDPNFKMPNYERRAPLHFAAETGAAKVIELLIQSEADPNIGDPAGVTPIMVAAKNKQKACVILLFSKGANLTLKTSNGQNIEDYIPDEDKGYYTRQLVRFRRSRTL